MDKSDGLMDRESQKLRELEAYSGLIKYNIDYDKNMNDLRDDAERKMFDDFYQLILEVVTGNVREYKPEGFNFFLFWVIVGFPFGIRRMWFWLLPKNFDIAGSIGILALDCIVGGLISVVHLQ